MFIEMYSKILKKNDVFKRLFSDKILNKLATKFKEKRYGPGEVIFKVYFFLFQNTFNVNLILIIIFLGFLTSEKSIFSQFW